MNLRSFQVASCGSAVLIGLVLSWSSKAFSADPVVGWRDVKAAVDAVDSSGKKGGRSASSDRAVESDSAFARLSAIDRVGPGLPPPPRGGAAPTVDEIQPASLAGISSSIVPAVTGDLYWSRPVMDMRVIGQSLGQNSTLRLSRPPVGVSVGSTSSKPALVGIK